MSEPFPYHTLRDCIASNDVRGVEFLLRKRGPYLGKNGVIDLDADYSVFSLIPHCAREIVDLFLANDRRTAPHILHQAARAGNLDLMKYIGVSGDNLSWMMVCAGSGGQRNVIEYLVSIGGKLRDCIGPASAHGHVELALWAARKCRVKIDDSQMSMLYCQSVKQERYDLADTVYNMSTEPELLPNEAIDEDDKDTLLKILQIHTFNPSDMRYRAAMTENVSMLSFLTRLTGSKA